MVGTDIGWEHGAPFGRGFKCNYCGKSVRGGGVTRLKQHLAGCHSVVSVCEDVPSHVKKEMLNYLSERAIKPRKRDQRTNMIQSDNEDEVIDTELPIEQDLDLAMKQSKEDPDFKFQQDLEKVLRQSKEDPDNKDIDFKFQQQIEEVIRKSKEDPDYKEIEAIQIAMQESQRLASRYSEASSSAPATKPVVLIGDSDDESILVLSSSEDENF